jgi:hypothetical protein
MRRGMLLGVTAALMSTVLVAMPAQAHRAVNNSWTQIENGNWPVNSSNPSCSPCVKWPNYYSGNWSFGLSKYGFYHTQALSAMKEWNGQPYPSPVFSEGASGCSSGSICVTARYITPGYCGEAQEAHSGNTIVYAWSYLGIGLHYIDGPVPPDTAGCDVRQAYHHELGHNWAEGHSSKNYDLMYWSGTKTAIEHVDSDSRHLLSAVYGSFNTGPCAPCLNLQALKQKELQEAASLASVVTEQEDTL